jgi:hypothetical protein
LTTTPEFNVGTFAFLVNYPWEFLQVPFFENLGQAEHWDAILFCTRATIGDAVIMLAAFLAVALIWRNRSWIRAPTKQQLGIFVALGVLVTVVLEWHATEVSGRWAYAPSMPVLPMLGTGLLPLVQWLLLPLLVVWFVKRQLLGSEHRG